MAQHKFYAHPVSDGAELNTGTTTGVKLGTANTQKLGLFGATPVTQQGATSDLGTVLSNLGVRVAGTAYPVTTSGSVSLTGVVTVPDLRRAAATKTNDYVLTTADYLILGDATTTNLILTLPNAATAGAGREFVIKKIDSAVNTVTIGGTIDGAANFVLTKQYQTINVVTDGTAWYTTREYFSSDFAAKQDVIPAGTTSQFYRGDKTFQSITKADVGLANVDNTADASKSFLKSQITDATPFGQSVLACTNADELRALINIYFVGLTEDTSTLPADSLIVRKSTD